MKKLFNTVIGIFILLGCCAVMMWHSLCIVIDSRRGRLQTSTVNYRLRRGSQQILALIGAKYQISFSSDIALDKSRPLIYMANHLSFFDLPLLYASMPGTIRFLVKKSLFKVPFFGQALRDSDFVSVDIGRPENMQELLDEAKAKLNQGVTLFIFPEGMRSLDGKLTTFKAGGFRLALEAGAQIIPVALTGTEKALPALKLTLTRRQSFSVRVGKVIDSRQFSGVGAQKLLMQRVEEAIRELQR